jgi:hypothetical protein
MDLAIRSQLARAARDSSFIHKHFVPVALDEVYLMKWDVESLAHPLAIFGISRSRTVACFVSLIPILHKYACNIIP